jgi:flavin-dependent dehydrogenase
VFHQLLGCPWYYNETRVEAPHNRLFTVERGSRPGSIDSLLYPMCLELGIKFHFGSTLKKEDIPRLAPNTIIACGLSPSAYEMLDIPFVRWYGWLSRGECGFSNYSWIYLDKNVTDFGYLASVNNYYFNLYYSTRHVDREALDGYRAFMRRNEGLEQTDWEYVSGAVPLASPDNPRLFRGERGDLIMCGTISGAMDPMMWFGILGAIVTGKVAALAVTDREKAQGEFERFTRRFGAALFLKNQVFYRLRPHVDAMERAINALGVPRVERLVSMVEKKDLKGSIPGFGMLGCY